MPHPDSIPAFWSVRVTNGKETKPIAAYLEEPVEAVREATLWAERHFGGEWTVTGEGLEQMGGTRWIPREAVLAEYPYLRQLAA